MYFSHLVHWCGIHVISFPVISVIKFSLCSLPLQYSVMLHATFSALISSPVFLSIVIFSFQPNCLIPLHPTSFSFFFSLLSFSMTSFQILPPLSLFAPFLLRKYIRFHALCIDVRRFQFIPMDGLSNSINLTVIFAWLIRRLLRVSSTVSVHVFYSSTLFVGRNHLLPRCEGIVWVLNRGRRT